MSDLQSIGVRVALYLDRLYTKRDYLSERFGEGDLGGEVRLPRQYQSSTIKYLPLKKGGWGERGKILSTKLNIQIPSTKNYSQEKRMQIIENRADWEAHFEANWLKYYHEHDETNWKIYQYPKNETAPSGSAIDVSQSKLLFVTTSGAYLKDTQEAYDADSKIGDYSIRLIPQSTDLHALAFAHTHYNHMWIDSDPQVLVPLRLLETMVSEGKIGSLAENIVAFSGYMPDVSRVIDELIPQIVGIAKDQQVDAALLVPAWPLCTQAVSLIGRALEIEGIPATMTTWRDGIPRLVKPPRVTFTQLPRGCSLGAPHDEAQQRRVIEATLALLEQEAPIAPHVLDESLDEDEYKAP